METDLRGCRSHIPDPTSREDADRSADGHGQARMVLMGIPADEWPRHREA